MPLGAVCRLKRVLVLQDHLAQRGDPPRGKTWKKSTGEHKSVKASYIANLQWNIIRPPLCYPCQIKLRSKPQVEHHQASAELPFRDSFWPNLYESGTKNTYFRAALEDTNKGGRERVELGWWEKTVQVKKLFNSKFSEFGKWQQQKWTCTES